MPQRQTLSAVLAGLLILLVTVRIGVAVVHFRAYQMDMDEATHAARGIDFVAALVQGNADEFWFQLTKPHWYPPAHGLLLGAWLLLWGADLITVRLYSTFCFLLFGLLLWLIARQHARVGRTGAGHVAGNHAAIDAQSLLWLIPPLFLAADALHSVYAAMSMLELPTILCAFGALFLFTRAGQFVEDQPRKSAKLFASSALLALLCFWMKYSNGLLVLTTLFLSTLLLFLDRPGATALAKPSRAGLIKAVVPAWVLIIFGLFIWLVLLDQAPWVRNYANAQPTKFGLWQMDNLLYYPRLLVGEPINALALLLSLITLPQLVRHQQLRQTLWPYLLFFGVGLAMITATLQNNVRFIMPILPPLWVIGGAGLVSLYQSARGNMAARVLTAITLLVLLFGLVRSQRDLPQQLTIEYENSNSGVDEAYAFIAQTLDLPTRGHAQIALLGRADQWNGMALHFMLTARCLQVVPTCHLSVVDNKEMSEGWPRQEFTEQVQQERRRHALAQADLLVLFSELPEPPDQWRLLDERPFVFERYGKEPREVLVGVWEKAE